jgi:hypothetical protein
MPARRGPLWSAPRIHGELQKLGVEVSQATVSKYLVRHRRPPSQTWRTFSGIDPSQQSLSCVDRRLVRHWNLLERGFSHAVLYGS